MRILILNQYFPPDTAATAKMAAVLAEKLAERHHVTVLAGRPSYDPSEHHPFYLSRREVHGNLVIERVGSTSYPRFQMRRRLANYLSYLALAVPRALTIPADVILAMTDPPVAGIAGAFIAQIRRRPFVYNIRDLYPDMAVAAGIVTERPWVRSWERLHRWALRRASKVIVLGDDAKDRVVSKGLDPSRVVVVRDGAAIPRELSSRDHAVARDVRNGAAFVLLHAGNLGFYGAWDTLVAAARAMDGEGVSFTFVGDGALRGRLESSAAGCHSVRLMPFRPPQDVPHVMAAADAHVVTVRRGLEGVVVPSKLYPILAAGRAVLAIAPENTDVARVVRKSRCGAVADPDDPLSVIQAVRYLRRDSFALEEMGRRARQAAHEFERNRLMELFVRTIEEVNSQ